MARLPEDIRGRLVADFGEAGASEAANAILGFSEELSRGSGHSPGDRLIRCIVHLAAGDSSRLMRGIQDARVDWRDVIRSAEYDQNDARVRDFSLPFPERTGQDAGSPESVVAAFIAAMNAWEREAWAASRKVRDSAHPDSFWPEVAAGVDRVFAEFCTPRKRPQGRQATFSGSPEYDPATEKIVGSGIQGNRAHVDTHREALLGGGLYRYVLHRRGGKWLIDNLKRRGDDDWQPAIL